MNSTIPKEREFATPMFVSAETFRFAKGCENERVVLQGIVNIMCSGMENACAQCTWPMLGGFAMIASATNGA